MQHKPAVWDGSKKYLSSNTGATGHGEIPFLGTLVVHQHITFYAMQIYI